MDIIHRDHRDHKAVKQGTPEICHTHCLREVRKAPALRQGQDPGDAVCHLAGLLECDHDRHIEWKTTVINPMISRIVIGQFTLSFTFSFIITAPPFYQ